jgi:FkbM family methyltransferase
MSDPLCRRSVGVATECGDENLLDLFRAACLAKTNFRFNGDILELSLPIQGRETHLRLRLNDSDVRVVRELLLHDEYRAMREIAPENPRRIVDAGANVGISALLLRRTFPVASIVCIEPDAANAARIQLHLKENGVEDVEVFQAALWPVDDLVDLSTPAQDSQSWAIQAKASKDGRVRAISVLTLMKELGWDRIDLLKMDIEGGEFPVFSHPTAKEWLPRVQSMVGEYHPDLGDEKELLRSIESEGFKVEIRGRNLFSAMRTARAKS